MQQHVVYAFVDTVTEIEERSRSRHVGGVGPTTEFRQESLGWFVTLDKSRLSIRIGSVQPDLRKGDQIKILITK